MLSQLYFIPLLYHISGPAVSGDDIYKYMSWMTAAFKATAAPPNAIERGREIVRAFELSLTQEVSVVYLRVTVYNAYSL